MFLPKVSDIVVYGTNGVCEITEIKEMEFLGKSSEYFVLKPIGDMKSTVFLPVDNDVLLKRVRPVLTSEEIYALIDTMPSEAENWIGNDTLRKKRYSEILSGGDRSEIIGIIKTLYLLRKKKEAAGKKLRISDASFLKEAEKQLYSEFAYVLNIPFEEVVAFICQRLGISDTVEAE